MSLRMEVAGGLEPLDASVLVEWDGRILWGGHASSVCDRFDYFPDQIVPSRR
jgi:hypothetical protein